ncbi:hypothetical protein GGQ80_001578 [Sphingomonas jinjuensis]|uniref:Uncharacterized protein n=1 Tax=Sphingomonas jinjuensis TaxID=535907 RepID=A0A840FAL6_9SPHN|nr:hypothetical protein [Sphingomonas jinjuensis]MBB4153672.1 hypothetical protein [Sphingomonas jinjuensis]
MKMGIKEFRERLGEVAIGDQVIEVTHHGKRVGRYMPERLRTAPDIDLDAWAKQRVDAARRWREQTPDWRERLKAFGIPADEIEGMEADDQCS